jgi:hypothetical protein
MLIQIRGTSGSGKTHVAKSLITWLMNNSFKERLVYREGRNKPIVQQYQYKNVMVTFIGHYCTPCGGVDTVSSRDEQFSLAKQYLTLPGLNCFVLMEGVLLSDEITRTVETAKLLSARIFMLNTPIDVCIQQINARRLAKGNTKPVAETNTRNRVRSIENAGNKLVTRGLLVKSLPVEDCIACIKAFIQFQYSTSENIYE